MSSWGGGGGGGGEHTLVSPPQIKPCLSLQVWSRDRCIYALSTQLFLPCLCSCLLLRDVEASNNLGAE